ncbi:hypothetical protein V6L77_00050 [Pannonibacter sp. Pt2-lr]
MIMQGAVPRFLAEIGEAGGLKGTDIANIMDVSKATVSRWRAGDIAAAAQRADTF